MKKQNANPLMEEMGDCVLDLRAEVEIYHVFDFQAFSREDFLSMQLAVRYHVHKSWSCEQIYCDTLLCALVSLFVPVPYTEGAYAILHPVTLQQPTTPQRKASLLGHSPVILLEPSCQKGQHQLFTHPTRSSGMSANPCFFLL